MEQRYTPDGTIIVSEGDTCPHWERGEPAAVITMRECWFCKWSDFREDLTTHKKESFCRNPLNRKRERETV